jgi:hypothetical protein
LANIYGTELTDNAWASNPANLLDFDPMKPLPGVDEEPLAPKVAPAKLPTLWWIAPMAATITVVAALVTWLK